MKLSVVAQTSAYRNVYDLDRRPSDLLLHHDGLLTRRCLLKERPAPDDGLSVFGVPSEDVRLLNGATG